MAGALDLARPAGDGDAVGGVPARLVAAPASTEEAAALLRAAADRDLAVVVRGGGTTVDWGNPPERLDLIVDTRRLAGVVEHAAGDLIAVVPRTVLDTGAQVLVTANPGCLMQVAALRRQGGDIAVAHTAQVLDASIRGVALSVGKP
jgi:hypothetical protein